MPILCSSLPGLQPGKARLDDESGELFSVDFGEHDEQIGKATVADPHFLAVQDIVRAFGIQLRAGKRDFARRCRLAAPRGNMRR